jgi:D-3-phosphoglycerate dehydrogenase
LSCHIQQTKHMPSYRILNIEPSDYCEDARSLLMDLGSLTEKEMARDELINELNNYDVLVVRLSNQIDQEILNAGRRLLAIVTATTGLDHIDVEYAKECGIAVLSLQGETDFLRSILATAEHTWAMLLALMRRIVPASQDAIRGNWNRDAFRGHELQGKHLGLVGFGRIGLKIAEYGQAFGMEVAAFDPFTKEWKKDVGRAQSLDELLKWSNILSLHIPLNAQTHQIIGAPELALLPQNAVLVNTSRGQLIDENALVKALGSGRVSGAALDVIDNERNEKQRRKSQLLAYAKQHDNLLISPHIGGATYESMAKTEMFMARKLANFLSVQERSHK